MSYFFIFLTFLSLKAYSGTIFSSEELIESPDAELAKDEIIFRSQLNILKTELQKISPESNPWPILDQKFIDAQKEKPLIKQSEFYRLNRFFKKISILKFNPHPEKLNTWQIEIDSDVDLMGLKIWANSLISGRNGKRLVIVNQTEYLGFVWTEMEVEKAEFESSFDDLWVNHFREFDLSTISEIEFCRHDCLDQYNNWKMSKEPKELKDSLILELKFRVSSQTLKVLLGETRLNLDGGVVLLDGNNKKIIYHRDLPSMTKSFNLKNKKELNSKIATEIYRFPLGLMPEIKKTLLSLSQSQNWRMKLLGVKSLSEILKIKDWIQLRGINKGGEVSLESFSQNQSVLRVIELGEEKSNQDRLKSLKELESILGRKCDLTEVDKELQINCGLIGN